MENKFLWQEQFEQFEQAYCSEKITEQYKKFRQEHLGDKYANNFIPREAEKLYTYENNLQYHLNGRSILGIQRKWILEEKNQYKTKHGCSINTGLIQSDHSGFMRDGNMGDTFVEAKDKNDLLDIAKRLLNLSNEEMAREFNIMSSQYDMATLFNAVILDPIIDYEIERDNFEGYSRCWNDSNSISISTKDKEGEYTIELPHSDDRYNSCKNMIIELPNGESISFRQKFNSEKGNEYTIDDISTEIVEVKGNSELLQKVVAQIERFSERELEQQEDTIEHKAEDDSLNSEELLKKQYCPELNYNDKNEVIYYINNSSFDIDIEKIMEMVSDEIKNDKDFFKKISDRIYYFGKNLYKYMGTKLKNDEEFILNHVDECIFWASENLKGDKEFMTKALQKAQYPIRVVSSASPELKSDKAFILEALAHDDEGYLVLEADLELQKDPDIQAVVLTKYEPEKTLQAIKKNIAEIETINQKNNTALQQKEKELSSLETEAKTISEAEALIDQQKEGKDIGE